MPSTEPLAETGRRRRVTALAIFIVSAVVIGSALVLLASESTLISGSVPAEALLIFMIPGYLFIFGWWFFGLLLIVGMVLLIRAPKPLPLAIFGAIVLVAGGIAVTDLVHLYDLG
ncbi:hypothetical protein [Microbacterium sp. LWO13-1.2]|uniref:hypothetical protein n=1 Tax=Microbacterium sp. LWO13-1.2 TaxID=3135262 RepID=UPI0031388C27